MSEFSHYDKSGKIRMVDISGKDVATRHATAAGLVKLSPTTVSALRDQTNPKGDPLEIARIAGIMGAKKTSELIPLCHQIDLSKVDVRAELRDDGIYIEAEAVTDAKTGVEMEALTAVTVAGLTLYDMLKAVERGARLTDIRLVEKTGGKSGDIKLE